MKRFIRLLLTTVVALTALTTSCWAETAAQCDLKMCINLNYKNATEMVYFTEYYTVNNIKKVSNSSGALLFTDYTATAPSGTFVHLWLAGAISKDWYDALKSMGAQDLAFSVRKYPDGRIGDLGIKFSAKVFSSELDLAPTTMSLPSVPVTLVTTCLR